jgi:glycosyltransferase involved in cell wall biosynthesis
VEPLAQLTVLHTVGSLDPAAGGPSRTVPAIVKHLQQARSDWRIAITTNHPEQSLISDSEYTILHDHGQWSAINRASARLARNRQLPRVVSPRGMLSPWARRYKWWKKSLAWRLFAKRDLAEAVMLHATSELEARELRALGVQQPIAIIPNGVEPLATVNFGPAPERPYVLFLSRIHEKKGIHELLRVWGQLPCRDWDLVLAGPDEQCIMVSNTLPDRVRYVGSVDGAAKARLLSQASLFVLPTHSENFGVVVAESLLAGVPVITTYGAPWQSLQTNNCGWWIPMSEPTLLSTLSAAMQLPPAERRAMGQRGQQLAQREFGWPRIASEMAAVYEWILGGGTPPACVVTN